MALPPRAVSQDFRRMLEQLPIPVTHCSCDFRYVWVNRAYAQWLGLEPKDINGRLIVEVIGSSAMDKLLPFFHQVLAGQSVRYEEEVAFPGLGARSINVTYDPLRDDQGNVEGWVAMVNDVTDRRKAEEALREGHRRKDEFLATLAHELRNPLAPIRNAVEFLRARGPQTPELEWSRDVIERQARQLGRLVDDLLNLSRISLGKIRLEMERIPVTSFVVQAIETSRPLIEEHGHTLDVEMAQDLVFVDGDLIRLSQVVTNLLNNAAKYTPRGGRIEVAVRQNRAAGDVSIRVVDTGIGIPPHMLASIFDLFVQVGDPREHSAGGLGIGLTLAQKVIALHGGTIEVQSDGPGQGSSFTIRLPVAPAPVSTPKPVRLAVEPKSTARHRILIVDDNPDNTDSLAVLLQLTGHEILTAYGAEEALSRAAEFEPSVVLLDIGMPGMGGHELARKIRGEPWGRAATLIALTGWGQDDDRRRSQEAGVDHHLTKPVELAEIMRLLPENVPASIRTV